MNMNTDTSKGGFRSHSAVPLRSNRIYVILNVKSGFVTIYTFHTIPPRNSVWPDSQSVLPILDMRLPFRI